MIRFILELFKKYPFEKKKLVLAVLVGGLVVLTGVQKVVMKDLRQARQLRLDAAEVKKKQTVASGLAVWKAQIAQRRSALAATSGPDWMIEAVQKAALSSGMSLISVSPQPTGKGEDLEKISLLVEAEGKYHQVGEFLAVLENHLPVLWLSHFRMERGQEPGKGRVLRLNVLLTAFREAGGGSG